MRIHAVTREQALQQMHDFLADPKFHLVTTPNNEILLKAQKNPEFLKVLNSADLNVADSTGLMFAAKLTDQHLPERVTGIDTMTEFCSQLQADVPVFLLGAAEGIAAEAAQKLQLHNPQLTVVGTHAGSPFPNDAEAICQQITASGAQVLFVAFGAPKQELWLANNAHNLPTVRLGMGVGGSFDFVAGKISRAPKLLRALGLEWFWRLLQEPKRLPRMWNATVVFMVKVLRFGKRSF